MEWKIKISNKPNYRIVVIYSPTSNLITMVGEYRMKNRGWVTFYTTQKKSDIDLDALKEVLFDVYEQMKIRVKKYEDLNKVFEIVNDIGIIDDDNNDENVELSDDYGTL